MSLCATRGGTQPSNGNHGMRLSSPAGGHPHCMPGTATTRAQVITQAKQRPRKDNICPKDESIVQVIVAWMTHAGGRVPLDRTSLPTHCANCFQSCPGQNVWACSCFQFKLTKPIWGLGAGKHSLSAWFQSICYYGCAGGFPFNGILSVDNRKNPQKRQPGGAFPYHWPGHWKKVNTVCWGSLPRD